MKPTTVTLLNQLNQRFYQITATDFDATRQRPWDGWYRCLPYIKNIAHKPLRVLDVGCGNGRFATFLADEGVSDFHYTGIDFDEALLDHAQQRLSEAGIAFRLETRDILQQPFGDDGSHFDLVVMFGVMHHIPAYENRRLMLGQLVNQLADGGLLMVTAWAFMDHEKLSQRVISWNSEAVPEAYRNLDIEPHDYLLDWKRGQHALRYCHHVDVTEQARLLADFSVHEIFAADACNRYWILSR